MADLYHYGVKGQKWGVKRKTNYIHVKANANTRYNNRGASSIQAPGLGGVALKAYVSMKNRKIANKIIQDSLNIDPKTINKKSLKNARNLIINYDHIQIRSAGENGKPKSKWHNVN